MLFGDLEDLEDILNEIIPDENEVESTLSVDEEIDIINTAMQLMTDYIDENPCAVTEPDFHEIMIENVKELLFMHFDNFFKRIQI